MGRWEAREHQAAPGALERAVVSGCQAPPQPAWTVRLRHVAVPLLPTGTYLPYRTHVVPL